jgi:hypothetical protein
MDRHVELARPILAPEAVEARLVEEDEARRGGGVELAHVFLVQDRALLVEAVRCALEAAHVRDHALDVVSNLLKGVNEARVEVAEEGVLGVQRVEQRAAADERLVVGVELLGGEREELREELRLASNPPHERLDTHLSFSFIHSMVSWSPSRRETVGL